MLQSVKLKFTENSDIELKTTGITVFVGPNNSGKSLVLRELEQTFSQSTVPTNLQVIRDYEIVWPSLDEVKASLPRFEKFKEPGLAEGHVTLGRLPIAGNGREAVTVSESELYAHVSRQTDKRWLATHYLRWSLIRLDGRSRFELTNDREAGDLLTPPSSALASIFRDDDTRKKIRDLIYDAFKRYFLVDPTRLGYFRIRLSDTAPPADEQSLNKRAQEYFGKAVHVKNASDGVQAFTGIVTAVLSGEYSIILIDEPEAFLHPPLARKLGKNLARVAAERGGAVLASTHSPDFLMGCVQASKDVRVVRLEYNNGRSKGRLVDPIQIENLFRHPLMRSANVISALFHDGVIVTESDNDRVFYSEIYHRMTEREGNHPSLLFVNAQNKQTTKEIVGPLRQFGVPAVAIMDIDVLKDGGKTWTEWLAAAGVPPALHGGYATQRAALKSSFDASGKDMKSGGGVAALNASDRAAADQLFDNLDEHGLFIVRRGELESWLQSLGVPGKKTEWTIAMLEKMGSNPSDAAYVRPATGDIWAFMDKVVSWVSNASRKGVE